MRGPALVTAVCASVTVIAGAGVLATPPVGEPVPATTTVTVTETSSPVDTSTALAPVVAGCVMFCRATEFDGSAR